MRGLAGAANLVRVRKRLRAKAVVNKTPLLRESLAVATARMQEANTQTRQLMGEKVEKMKEMQTLLPPSRRSYGESVAKKR